MSKHWKSARVSVLLAALALVALAGCGGGGGSTAAAASADGTAVANAANADMQAFTDCLKEHGVDVPEGGLVGGPGQGRPGDAEAPPASVDSGAFDAAREACADLLPSGAAFGGGPVGVAGGDSTAFDAYRSCMSDHGVSIPEAQTPQSIDRGSDGFAAANDVCSALLPERAPLPNGGQPPANEGTNP